MGVRELTSAVPVGQLSSSSGTCEKVGISSERNIVLTRRGLCSGSLRYQGVLASWERNLVLTTGRPLSGRERIIEKLWKEFFSDPSQWWDHRPEKVNPNYPDFKHRETQQSLWLNGISNPPWVETALAAMAPGTLQSSIFSWNKRLARCVKARQYEKTLEEFQQMRQEGMRPDKFTFIPVLNACSSLQALEEGKRIHAQIIESGFESDVFVGNCLLDMYAKCGNIGDAQRVFQKMPTRNVISWSAMILAYVKCGQALDALELYQQMLQQRVKLDPITFVGVVNACASVGAIGKGRIVHGHIIQSGYDSDVFVGSSLVNMYAKCDSIEDAWRVFKKMPTRDVVAWSAMILGLVKCGQPEKALELSYQMQEEGVEPDPVTFVGLLKACASVAALEEGQRVHKRIIPSGFESNVFVGSSLVDMYAKCGSIDDARQVFNRMPTRNVFSWSAMILGYVKCGQGLEALNLSRLMQQEGVNPDPVTFVGVLSACASVAALGEGRRVHKQIIASGCLSSIFVRNSLIDMYVKCGSFEEASTVFNTMPMRDGVTWSTMILGCVRCGQGKKALELSRQMQREGVELTTATFVGMLNACASIAALEEGQHVHGLVVQKGWDSNVFVCNSLIDMYAKCGSIEDAQSVFNKMRTNDLVSWNTMLGGYAMHGHAKEALVHFEEMWQAGIEVDGITFVSLLSACSRAGLVDEGLHYFESMSAVYNIPGLVDHYTCLVDLLGRGGHLREAENLINIMSCEPNADVWMCLLAACRLHDNVEIGERVAQRLLEMDPESAAGCLLLSNIYAAAGKWDGCATLKREVLKRS